MDNVIDNSFRIIDNIRYINQYFEDANSELPYYGIFIGCAETKRLSKVSRALSDPYNSRELSGGQVFPTRSLYFYITRYNNRVLPLPEILGRLASCGFDIVDYKIIENQIHFVARKIKEPVKDKKTYGPLIKLKRIGKDGKIIHVFKFRTMHPYSEYLQEFIYCNNSLREGGKFKNDFRVTNWGKILRRFWIDEIPMILNWFKRDLKLVGVRPISMQYLSLYPEDYQKERIKFKPGLVPPFYADMPKTLEEIIESEKRYLQQYAEKPVRTDIKYFFKVLYNIIFKNARSG